MIENLKTKYTIYFARRWLEEVLTQCRRMEGFLNHLRRDAHLNSRYPYSAEEIKARQRIKAYDARPEHEGADDTFDAIDTVF